MSLYEQLGGNAGMKTAVSVFYSRVLDDNDLSTWFEGVDLSRLRSHQRAFLSAALGGPDLFAGRDLAAAHEGLAITHEAYDAIVEHLASTLHDLGAPDMIVGEVRTRLEALRGQVVESVPSSTGAV